MQEASPLIHKIADLVLKIQKDAKIGTAYERYDTLHLWDLGRELVQYEKSFGKTEDPTAEILQVLANQAVKCQPVLLRNAQTSTRIWRTREDFQKFARDISYGKLKAVLPLIDPDFVAANHIPAQDVDGLVDMLSRTTYEDVLLRVRALRAKYDPRGQSLDLDDFYQELYTITEDLRRIVEKKQKLELEEFRSRFPSALNSNSRRLIAAMKSEEAFKRLDPDIPKNFDDILDSSPGHLASRLNGVLVNLSRIRSAHSARDRLRERIGIARLGELSTLMKAASSDKELEMYLRGQRLLEHIRVTGIGKAN